MEEEKIWQVRSKIKISVTRRADRTCTKKVPIMKTINNYLGHDYFLEFPETPYKITINNITGRYVDANNDFTVGVETLKNIVNTKKYA